MSIQTYNKAIYYEDRLTDGKTPLSELSEKNGMAMDFTVVIKTTVSKDRWTARSVNFTVVGKSDDAISDTNVGNKFYALIEAGSRVASNIAYLSKGVISGFYAKLGKHRNDEACIDVPVGDNSRGSILFTANENDQLGKLACDRTEQFPVMKAQQKIYIPWLRDDVSRQDMRETLEDWQFIDANSKMTFNLGIVKFKDDNQVDMICSATPFAQSIKSSEYSRSTGVMLVNNDSSLGIFSDKVLSESYNTFAEGKDDIASSGSSASDDGQ